MKLKVVFSEREMNGTSHR